jgi:hypothetical protein
MSDANKHLPQCRKAILSTSRGEFALVGGFIKQPAELIVDRNRVTDHSFINLVELRLTDAGDGNGGNDRHIVRQIFAAARPFNLLLPAFPQLLLPVFRTIILPHDHFTLSTAERACA